MSLDTHSVHSPTSDRSRRSAPQRSSSFRFARLALAALVVISVGAVAASRIPAPLASDVVIPPDLLHVIGRETLSVTVTEQGKLESSQNTEIKCKVRGNNTVIWVIESGSQATAGDVLVRLDTLLIEEEISERTKFAHLAESAVARSGADVARAELAISEYEQGRFVAQLAGLEKDLAIFQSNLSTAKNMLDHAKTMAESGYVSELEVEEKEFAVTRAKLDVELKQTEIGVLKNFTRAIELETLRGNLEAAKAMHEADKERAFADAQRRDRAIEELQHCVIVAERDGMVIHPKSQKWEDAPDIEEGATVHKDQVLLLMPDLSSMQVKVGVHESMIDRIEPGLPATVRIPERTIRGEVSSVAPIAEPAGWWTGNVVKYDTIVSLPATSGLKPGMTAEVELVLGQYPDALTIPAAAVVETADGYACWVKTALGTERQTLELGEASDLSVIVESGLRENDQVVMNPLSIIPEARDEASRAWDPTSRWSREEAASSRAEAVDGE